MTRLEKLKIRLEKLETAYDEVLLGNRLSKGDIEGLGNAEFQTVSAKTIEAEINKVKRQIAQLEGRSSRICGTPTLRRCC